MGFHTGYARAQVMIIFRVFVGALPLQEARLLSPPSNLDQTASLTRGMSHSHLKCDLMSGLHSTEEEAENPPPTVNTYMNPLKS